MAAAGSRRRRGSVGAGHAGGFSRVADLGEREAAADDDAIREPALGFLRARVRVRDWPMREFFSIHSLISRALFYG